MDTVTGLLNHISFRHSVLLLPPGGSEYSLLIHQDSGFLGCVLHDVTILNSTSSYPPTHNISSEGTDVILSGCSVTGFQRQVTPGRVRSGGRL